MTKTPTTIATPTNPDTANTAPRPSSDGRIFRRGDKVLATVRAYPEPATFRRYDDEGFAVVRIENVKEYGYCKGEISIDPNLLAAKADEPEEAPTEDPFTAAARQITERVFAAKADEERERSQNISWDEAIEDPHLSIERSKPNGKGYVAIDGGDPDTRLRVFWPGTEAEEAQKALEAAIAPRTSPCDTCGDVLHEADLDEKDLCVGCRPPSVTFSPLEAESLRVILGDLAESTGGILEEYRKMGHEAEALSVYSERLEELDHLLARLGGER